MSKYSIYQGANRVTAAVTPCAVKSYLKSYNGNLEQITIYAEEDEARVEGMSAEEWLADNDHVLAIPMPPEPSEKVPPSANYAYKVGWTDGYVAAAKEFRK